MIPIAASLAPKSGLRLNTGAISKIAAVAGIKMTYTSGCPMIQNRFA